MQGGWRANAGSKPKASTIVERKRKAGIDPQSQIAPRMPKHLVGAEKAEWRRVVRLLKEAGLIEQLDASLLEAYCVAYSRWVEAEAAIKTEGLLIKSLNGFPMQSPYLSIANKAMGQMMQILGELGMTPSSRSRIPRPSAEQTRAVGRNGVGPDPRDNFKGVLD